MIANTVEDSIQMTSHIQKRWLTDYMPYSRAGLQDRIATIMEGDWYVESVKVEMIPDIPSLWECQFIVSSRDSTNGVVLPFIFWDEDANVLGIYPAFNMPVELRNAMRRAVVDCRHNPTLVSSQVLLGKVYNKNFQTRIHNNIDEFVWERVYPGTVFAPLRGFIQHMHRYKFAVEMIRPRLSNQSIILDLACGCGYGSHYLASRLLDVRVFGVDSDAETIVDAGRLYSSDRNFWVLDDAEGLGNFPAQAVVCLELLEHMEEPESLLESVKRLLLPGGIAVISTPNGESLRRQNVNNPYHVKEYGYHELKKLLKAYFTEVSIFSLIQDDNYSCSVRQIQDGDLLSGDHSTDSFIACCQ